MPVSIVIVAAMLLGGFWWWRQRNMIRSENGINMVPTGDRDMEKAVAQARENFHFFVERLRNPQSGDENFAIKARIEHDGETEHIWLSGVQVFDGGFEGKIANDPQLVPLKHGDAWRGDLSALSDWAYFDNGRMQGNFTLRVMLPRMPRDQREQAQRMLESRWDTRELVHIPWPRNAEMPGRPLPDEISVGDSALMNAVPDHLTAHLGKGANVFHELVSPSAHIDLHPYPATAERPFHVIGTTGMAEKPMQLPASSAADVYVELVMLLPASWPLDFKSWQDERHWWPLRWLKRVARFHYETGRWLGEGHLLTHGAEPIPIDPSCPFDSVVLAPPRALPEAFQRVRLEDGRKVRLLCLYFLDSAERGELATLGWEVYADRLSGDRLSV